MFDGLFDPAHIESINQILNESFYADRDSIILPPSLYAVGSSYDAFGEIYVMVNLKKDNEYYGAIFAWRKAHNNIGAGDNKTNPVLLANDLQGFLGGLITEQESARKIEDGKDFKL
ncbi:hypothetical protein N0B44_12205 [Roseibacterium beibuensis]|uniref:Knr4/Smi1-like domain-containing protein n=1 Tax=[Roseibacterium] beibuensis TaxID=1193142 RepID=A0ABP9L6V3_9RHOB|nr:hypothetical protein [Roseibacterium beibuensis]MCS6623676.1 hypothetical protein [Roseibacterium beibuensis]